MDLHRSSKSRLPVEQESRGHYSATARNSHRLGSVPPLRSSNNQKQCPSTKGADAEELVKYMSNIPSYLHSVDRGNFQDKALNVGVLDWKHLEKWNDKHSQSCGDPQTSSFASSHISASRTSVESCGSSISPHPQSEYSSVLSNGQNKKNSEGLKNASKQSREKYKKYSKEKSDQKAPSCSMPLPSDDSLNQIQTPELQSYTSDQHLQDCAKDCCSVIPERTEGLLTTLREDVPGRCSSFESTAFGDRSPSEMYQQTFSGLLHEDVKIIEVSPQVPRSCPLSFSVRTDDEEFSSKESFKATNEDRNAQDEMEPRRTGRRLLPTRQFVVGLNRINRSSSLRDSSPKCNMEGQECSDALNENKEKANSKRRQSPLRRILEPLLKPMNRRRSSSPVAKSRLHNTSGTNKSPLKEDIISTEELWQSYDKQVGSTRQALLQLAWKNGLPLYMFSFNDNDILVATVSKKNDIAKDDLECIYTIFSVQEVKKKSGTSMNQGSRSKNDALISNVVSQMKVASSKPFSYNSKSRDVVREFTLFGYRVQSASSRFQVELAAVLVKDVKHNNHSLRNSIVAILPSGVHGLSNDGHPSPLIERWKSGGLCDCGGWDEGCTLRVFTDTLQEGQNSGPVQAHDDTHRVELFLQCGGQDKKHAFTMVAFKECLYTVDFGSSIGLLQAFAICIAILHSKNSPRLSRALRLAEKKSLQDHFSADHISSAAAKEAPVSYVPSHPPLSPYGRA